MKKTAMISLSLVILLALAGCSGKKEGQPVLQDLPKHPISQNGYYVNLPRQGQWDLYPEMDTAISFQVLTKEPPQDSDFYFDAEFFGRNVTWEAVEDEFPFWLYQTYRGMDWNKLAELRQKAEKGGEAEQQEFEAYESSFRKDYEALTPEDIPQIFGSLVTIQAQTGHEDGRRLREVSFKIGEIQETVPVGRLNLHGINLNETLPSVDEEVPMGRWGSIVTSYWREEAPLPEILVPPMEEDWTWTGLDCLGADVTLSDIQVAFSSDATENWDGKTPLSIPAGTEVRISGTIHHAGKGVLGYCGDCFLTIEQESQGRKQRLWFPMSLIQQWNIYELYALVEDGVDLTPYHAYADGYVQPKPPIQEEQSIPNFGAEILVEDETRKVEVVDVTADSFAYTIRLRGENFSVAEQVFNILGWAINGYRQTDPGEGFVIPAGQTLEMDYSFPWEVLNRYGVSTSNPMEIDWVEIFSLDLNGSEPCPIYSFSPIGAKRQKRTSPDGELLAEQGGYALYYMDSRITGACPLSRIQRDKCYCMGFVLENNSQERQNVTLTITAINGKNCSDLYCVTLEPMCRQVIYIEADYLKMGLSGATVEEVTVELDLRDNFDNPIASEMVTANPNFVLPKE